MSDETGACLKREKTDEYTSEKRNYELKNYFSFFR